MPDVNARRRNPLFRSTPLAVLLLLMVTFTSSCSGNAAPSLQPPTTPAPQFTLTNQNGETTSLSQLRGKIVVLTFLYTYCPDACPTLFQKIEQGISTLGNVANQVNVVIVTVDPKRDTVARLKDYSAMMSPDWLFLTGYQANLKSIWNAYGIIVNPLPEKQPGQGYEIAHTVSTLLIDKQGFRRLSLPGDSWQASNLAENIRQLINP